MVSRLFELMFEGSSTGVPRMYQGSFKGVLRKIEGCSESLLRVIQGRYLKEVQGYRILVVVKVCFKAVSKMF